MVTCPGNAPSLWVAVLISISQFEASEVVSKQTGQDGVRRQGRAVGEVAEHTAMLVDERRGSKHVRVGGVVGGSIHVVHGGD